MSAGIHLDELFLTKGAGAVDDETLRVQLSDESLAALENIEVTVLSEVEIKNDAGNPVPVSGTVSVAAINGSIKTSAASVTTTPAQVLASPLGNRKQVTIQNEGNKDVYIGDASVTTSSGIKISRNSSATYAWGPAIVIYMVASEGSQNIRFLEEA